MINKKGFELSVNFIVILIITLIVFAGSLTIAVRLLKSMDNLKDSMDKETEQRLESMINSGNEEVVIAYKTKEARGGEPAVFGIGVLNTLGVEKDFSVAIYPSTAINKTGGTQPFTNIIAKNAGWQYIQNNNLGLINNNDHVIKPLIIVPPENAATETTYVFDVNVTYMAGTVSTGYPARSPVQKIRVIVI